MTMELFVAVLREEFRVMPDNVQVALGDTATLKCAPPRGRPEPTTSWLRNGQPVAVDESRVKLIGHNLVITDVNQKDQGMYKCVARNMLGVRESPAAKLKVLGLYSAVLPNCQTSLTLLPVHSEAIFHSSTGRRESNVR